METCLEVIYKGMEALPFSFLQYDFMKNAVLAALLLSPVFALLGTMAVNNNMAFFSDALGHSAFAGIGIGVLLGLKSPLLSMLAFGILLSLFITRVKAANTASSDTIIGVFSTTAMALGIVILSRNGGFANYTTYLTGDILTVRTGDIGVILLVLIGAYLLWGFLYNALLLLSVSRSLAQSRGVKVWLTESIFVCMVAVVVMLSIRWLGILTINALLILPAAAARNVARGARAYHFLTTGIGLFSSLGGVIVSYYMGTSAGATMVLFSAILFGCTFAMRRLGQHTKAG